MIDPIERFLWHEGDLTFPSCNKCKHYFRDGNINCKAFPKRIPDEILSTRNDHRKPYPGDNGIQFEEMEKK